MTSSVRASRARAAATWRRCRAGWAALALLMCGPAAAEGLEYQVHGFAAQGFALSEGNNVIGDSTNGNFQYFELGVNGTVQTDYRLAFSAQELARKSGMIDDGDLRLDYGFVDFQALTGPTVNAGLRAGRVKNPFGLFNETRDVVFTRPGILMPSVYFDTSGLRSLLFSSDGGQAYAGWSHGSQYTSLVVNKGLNFNLNEDEKRNFSGGTSGLAGDLRFSDFLIARLMNDWSAGIFRVALSYATANLAYLPAPADFVPPFDVDLHIYIASAHYNAERLSLTGEYQFTESQSAQGEGQSDAAYLQADYRFLPRWSAMARVDGSFSDREDRQGETCTDNGAPADRHGCFTLAGALGLQWQPDEHWGVWSEFHLFDGTSSVPAIENQGRALDPHWNLFLLMAAYRF